MNAHPSLIRSDTISPTWPSAARAARRLLDLLATWQRRARDRQRLAAMDRHRLDDLGISRAEALAAAAKPFWRA